MVAWPSRVILAFDASAVCAVVLSRGFRGSRIEPLAEVLLPPGALVPQAAEENLARADEVREALASLHRALGGNGRRSCLVLPDGLARLQLLDLPAGVAPADFARYRLAPNLPFPAGEAIVDHVPVGRGRLLAAAVRRRVVRSYEDAALAAGFVQERVELAPLAAASALAARAAPAGRTAAVVLGDAAYSLSVFAAGALQAFRNRRRDAAPDEAERLRDEIARTVALAGQGEPDRVLVVGAGGSRLVAALRGLGVSAELGLAKGGRGDQSERAWLGSALA